MLNDNNKMAHNIFRWNFAINNVKFLWVGKNAHANNPLQEHQTIDPINHNDSLKWRALGEITLWWPPLGYSWV
jgi:hypothetical protein